MNLLVHILVQKKLLISFPFEQSDWLWQGCVGRLWQVVQLLVETFDKNISVEFTEGKNTVFIVSLLLKNFCFSWYLWP